MNYSQKQIEKTYLEIINEEYHRRPLLGWSNDKFSKIILKMLQKSIKKHAANEFDNYFFSSSLFSFKDLFDLKPIQTSVGGQGKNISIVISYQIPLKDDQGKMILFGKMEDSGSKGVGGFLKKLFKIDKKDRGILWNPNFAQELKDQGMLKNSDESGTNEDEEDFEDLDEESVKNNNKQYIITEADDQTLPYTEDDVEPIDSIVVSFVFKSIQYCKNCKQKDFKNPNRVESLKGTAFLKFIGKNGGEATIQVTEKGSVLWEQKRTSNMDPPTPISAELKKIWANPQQTTGLVGLAVKKVGGGLMNAAFGSLASSTIQNESFSCAFIDKFSLNNATGIAPKVEKPDQDTDLLCGKIKEGLEDGLSNISWKVSASGKDEINCTCSYEKENLIILTLKLK